MGLIMINNSIISISNMSGKLKGIRDINTSPLNNNWCKCTSRIEGSVCQHCYSTKMLTTFRALANKRFVSNGILLSDACIQDAQLPRFYAGEYVRIFAHGEFADSTQLKNIIRIVELNNLTHFTVWTKRVDLLDTLEYKPDNLRIVQSSLMLNIPDKKHKYADILFTVYDKDNFDTAKADNYCNGKKCIDCMFCYKSSGNVAELLK